MPRPMRPDGRILNDLFYDSAALLVKGAPPPDRFSRRRGIRSICIKRNFFVIGFTSAGGFSGKLRFLIEKFNFYGCFPVLSVLSMKIFIFISLTFFPTGCNI